MKSVFQPSRPPATRSGRTRSRGLQTLPLRVRAQQAGAEKLAAWLAGHAAVERVHHPSSHDPAGLVGRQMSGTGSLLAFEVRDGAPAAAAVACRLITHAVSLGGSTP